MTPQRSVQAFHYGRGAEDSRDEISLDPQGRQEEEEEEPESRPFTSAQMGHALAYLDTFVNGVDEKYSNICDAQRAMNLQLGESCSRRNLDSTLEGIRAVQQVSVTLANDTPKTAREQPQLIDKSVAETEKFSGPQISSK